MEIDHQKYGLVFSVYGQYLVTVFVSVFLSGLLRQNCVWVSFQKPFSFHMGYSAFLFSSLLHKEMWGKNLHTGEIENNLEELICQLRQKGTLIVF